MRNLDLALQWHLFKYKNGQNCSFFNSRHIFIRKSEPYYCALSWNHRVIIHICAFNLILLTLLISSNTSFKTQKCSLTAQPKFWPITVHLNTCRCATMKTKCLLTIRSGQDINYTFSQLCQKHQLIQQFNDIDTSVETMSYSDTQRLSNAMTHV